MAGLTPEVLITNRRYTGWVLERSAATGATYESLRYTIILYNILDVNDVMHLSGYTPNLPMFREVEVNAAEVGSPVDGWVNHAGLWVQVRESVTADTHCQGTPLA